MKCANCGMSNDGATEVGGPATEPGEGDISICMYCGAFGLYSEGKVIPLPVEKRVDLMMNHPEVWDSMIGIQKKLTELKKLMKLKEKIDKQKS